jgi:hypothetical protein
VSPLRGTKENREGTQDDARLGRSMVAVMIWGEETTLVNDKSAYNSF